MNGLGFYIYMLEWDGGQLPAPSVTARILKDVGAKWVSIKVADRDGAYNQIGGNDKILREYVNAIKDQDIEVGGWHYIYPENPGPQGARAAERIEKLGLEHLVINAEKEWKNVTGAKRKVELYLDNLGAKKNFPVGLTTYRFPFLHAEFPYSQFLNRPAVTFNQPQVYWVGLHNPAEQLEISYDQYQEITNKPYLPIGSIYNWGDWLPTQDDVKEFMQACKDFSAYGFYSFDWIMRNEKYEYLETIAGKPITITEPPKTNKYVITNCYALNFRNAPNGSIVHASLRASTGFTLEATGKVSGNWRQVLINDIPVWAHGYYLKQVD